MSHQDDVFMRLAIVIMLILTAFMVGAIILGNMLGDLKQESVAELVQAPASSESASAPQSASAPPEPAQPAASAQPAADDEADAPRSGEEVIQLACAACHNAGVAGAPKLGDEAAWADRAEAGLDTLVASVINGKGAMPPKGGNPSLSDEEIRRSVVTMLEQAGVEAGGGGDESGQQAAADAGGADEGEGTAAAGGAGKETYAKACNACHGTGAAGAPITGNAAQWESRIAKGMDTLYDHSINGFNAMPAKGGWGNLSNDEVKAAVDYMVAESR